MFSRSLISFLIITSLDVLNAHPMNCPEVLVPGAQDDCNKVLQARKTQEILTTCKKPGQFALTYDDGPYIYENQISNYLNDRNIKGSFFVNGNNYDCIYDENIVKQLKHTYSQGHVIGSHTWSHPDITTLSVKDFNQQLDLVETALQKILGIKPRFFRPPYGNINDENVRVLKSRGYQIVNWSFDSQDSIGATAQQTNHYYDAVAKHFPDPQIGLNHETYKTTATTTTPHAIAVLQRAGYRLVSVSECLGMGTKPQNFYQSIGKPQARDASWTCEGTPSS